MLLLKAFHDYIDVAVPPPPLLSRYAERERMHGVWVEHISLWGAVE